MRGLGQSRALEGDIAQYEQSERAQADFAEAAKRGGSSAGHRPTAEGMDGGKATFSNYDRGQF